VIALVVTDRVQVVEKYRGLAGSYDRLSPLTAGKVAAPR
jgi:hypothetical protein